jgi:hypothetical protein
MLQLSMYDFVFKFVRASFGEKDWFSYLYISRFHIYNYDRL